MTAPGHDLTTADVDELAARFRARTIPHEEWTHTAHLIVGAWHVHRYGPADALTRLRAGIRALNDVHGTPNSPTRGYHETITRAYVMLLARSLDEAPPETSLGDRVTRILAGPLAATDVLFAYYSRNRLLSSTARAEWVAPDILELPRAATRPKIDYDVVAPEYGRRYETQRFPGLEGTVRGFVRARPRVALVVDVGCGTGHWLRVVGSEVRRAVGIDPSAGMLAEARAAGSELRLVRGVAEQLPLRDASADRVVCMHAFQHLEDRRRFAHEARRILRRGGGILIVALDPHANLDAWWIYDAFPSARRLDRERYPATSEIRALLEEAGFAETRTTVAEALTGELAFDDALARGVLGRRSTSQLMMLDDAEWEEGLRRLHATRPPLRADLRLFATSAWLR